MNTAATVVTPMMIGMSSDWMACHISWPMPGQPNTFSTTTTPDMKMPMSRPIMAMIGRTALRKPWTRMTPPFGHALGAGGADIVLAQHLDHRGAHHARIPAAAGQPERHGRQDQVAAASRSRRAETSPADRRRHRAASARARIAASRRVTKDSVIATLSPMRAAPAGGIDAGRDADHQFGHDGAEHEQQGRRQAARR